MAKIAIIDDNTDQSSTAKGFIDLALERYSSSLEVITSTPFADLDMYFNYLQENQVVVLILDEKLNDISIGNQGPVSYKGSELISILREKQRELPIFALTTFSSSEDLVEKFSEYEAIINRQEFYNDPSQFVPKFWRASQNYLNENIEAFSDYNELTRVISSGNRDPELLKKMQALQVKFELPFSGYDDRASWLNEYESQIGLLEKINNLIKSKLEK
jgi:CheY-like chemotaxis protein